MYAVSCGSEEQWRALKDVVHERHMQDHQWGEESAKGQTPAFRLAILGEEFGEVSKEVVEGNRRLERVELVQLAAVAICTIEAIDRGWGSAGGRVA